MLNNKDTLPWIEKYRPDKLDKILSQEEIISTIKVFIKKKCLPHLLFYGLSGTGKCLAPNTKVLLFNGNVKKAKDINKHDLLMGDDNKPRKILNLTCGIDDIYKVKQKYGYGYKVNSAHIISLKIIKNFVTKGKYIYYLVNHELTKIKATSNIISDNRLSDINWNLKISNKRNKIGEILDINIIDFINKKNIWKKFYEGFWIDKLDYSENKIKKDLYDYGTKLRRSKTIKKIYMKSDIISRIDLLSGIVDEEATIKKNFVKMRFDNKKKLKQIFILSRSIGLIAKKKNNVCIIQGNLEILKLRKKKIIYNKEISQTNKIKIIKKKRGKYYGFEIDGNKRFLLDDLTVTHNTSTIMACAKELFGEYTPFMVMELNASDDRGIEIVRNKIKQFVTAKNVYYGRTENERKKIFKLVILDETDAMTVDAQAILRKIVEKYTYSTRFCLICNYIQNISPALQSRCTVFRFSPINEIYVKQKIQEIAVIEKIQLEPSGITTIIERSNGDMRKAINLLQSTSMASQGKKINEKIINNYIGYPRKEQIEIIMNSIINDDFKTCYEKIKKLETENDLALNDILVEVHNILQQYLINDGTEKKTTKSVKEINQLEKDFFGKKLDTEKIILILSELKKIEFNHSISINEMIQLGAFIGIFKK